MKKGKLILIPTPLGDDAIASIPAYVLEQIEQLDVFIAERAKTARRFIKAACPNKALPPLQFFELNKHTAVEELSSFLDAAERGQSIGLLSEAGCPAVADPGAIIVQMAHQKNIAVVPLVGPSSLILALMASGMNGQQFCFHGYLSVKIPELQKDLKRLEQQARRFRQTQIFIETPYRNLRMIEQAIGSLSPNTKFCVATDLTLDSQLVISKKIKDWKKVKLPDLHKRPSVFLIGH